MRVVSATRRHIAAMTALMTASPLLRHYQLTRDGARAGLAEALRAKDIVVVAVGQGSVAGFAWVIPTRALDRAAYLRLLLVAEGRQSRGVGAALLATAERRARAARCRHLVLLVTTANRRARAFYARCGYRHVGGLPGFVRPGIGESLYEKRLSRG